MELKSKSAQKIQEILNNSGIALKVREFSESTRTSAEAAAAVGCELGQIAKSLVFKTKTERAVLIIASGANMVDEKKVKNLIGEKIGKADADFVFERTGFVIGGIPPMGHKQEMQIIIDRDLMNYEEIWAAAGSPHAVFALSPKELSDLTAGQVADVKKG